MPCTPRSGRAFGCWKERPVSGPIWLNWPFAGVMVIFALYHGVRLVTAGQRGRPNGYDIDLAHLLMCTAMAAMLVMTFGAHLATAWAVVVGVPTLWFILRAVMALVSGGAKAMICLLYTSDAADDLTRVDLCGRRIITKK